MEKPKKTVYKDFTVHIDEPTHTRLRLHAFEEHKTMGAIVRAAIRNHLDMFGVKEPGHR